MTDFYGFKITMSIAMRFGVLFFLTFLGVARAENVSVEGKWEGVVHVNGTKVGYLIDVINSGGKLTGTMSAPCWGRSIWPLKGSVQSTGTVELIVYSEFSQGSFEFVPANDELLGTYRWNGNTYRSVAGRGPVLEARYVPRKQIPVIPIDYDIQPIEYQSDGIAIAGAITIPRSKGPHPLIVFAGGSSARRWHAEVPGNMTPDLGAWVWADELTRAGFCVLRTDARGVGKSGGRKADSTLRDLSTDILNAMKYASGLKYIDDRQIGLMGISQGADVVTIASNRTKQAAFLIRLSGSGVPIDQVFLEQRRLLYISMGLSNPQSYTLDSVIAMHRKLYELCKTEQGVPGIRSGMAAWISERKAAGESVPPGSIDALIDAAASPLARSELRYDPKSDLEKIVIPCLHVHGSDDILVSTQQNVPAIKAAFSSSPANTKVLVLEGLDHGLRKSKNQQGGDAPHFHEIVNDKALHAVKEWLAITTGKGANRISP